MLRKKQKLGTRITSIVIITLALICGAINVVNPPSHNFGPQGWVNNVKSLQVLLVPVNEIKY